MKNEIVGHQYGISADYLDHVLKHQLSVLKPLRIVDFGAGQGKNGSIVREVVGQDCELIAVEGCPNTVEYLTRQNIYSSVSSLLLQEWLQQCNQRYDVALFGDVLEHLLPKALHQTIRLALQHFDYIVIVVPLHNIFQGAAYDNPLEEHQTYVTRDFFKRYKVLEQHVFRGEKAVVMNLLITSNHLTGVKDNHLSFKVFHLAMLLLQPLGLAKPFVTLLKKFGKSYKHMLFRK